MNPQQISIQNFTYELPNDRIAQHPLPIRDESKLLVYKNLEISESKFAEIDNLFEENDCFIFNETKVIQARLIFENTNGSKIEIFCLEPFEPKEIEQTFSSKNACKWICLIGNNKRWNDIELKKNKLFNNENIELNAERISQKKDSFVVEFKWNSELNFAEIIQLFGIIPLPPYLKRDAEKEDESRYQTVYAKSKGSVAAPTAGLHFTESVFTKLKRKNISSEFVTLHVGAGTFMPVKSETMQGHDMHEEKISVHISLIEKLLSVIENKNKIVAVGTTSFRTIESIYWFGFKLFQQKDNWENINELNVEQWQPYEKNELGCLAFDSLSTVLSWLKFKNKSVLTGSTKIIIMPGYDIKIIDVLVTNFHQPKSTLLLLVAALCGENWRDIYDFALKNNFRFLSYGDSSVLFRN